MLSLTISSLFLVAAMQIGTNAQDRGLEDNVRILQEHIKRLTEITERLRSQNADLETRVEYLESCGACSPQLRTCAVNGQVYREGDAWRRDRCDICTCQDGRVSCSRQPGCEETRPELDCPGGCQNGGSCVQAGGNSVCKCESPFEGTKCEIRKLCPCYQPLQLGSPTCNNPQTRYYYDIAQQECLPFRFQGCGGNENNFASVEFCKKACTIGACCFRQLGSQASNSVKCQVKTLPECKALHKNQGNQGYHEVISFKRGLSCEIAQCGGTKCSVGGIQYENRQRFRLGCQECACEDGGKVRCRCDKATVRKEIRDLTPNEMLRYQRAIQELKETKVWDAFTDVYHEHIMHSTGMNYLLWNRAYLRQVEQKLQEIDCSIAIPYFEVTTDVGQLYNAILWQPNYFGGENSPNCVNDHPFGSYWSPCIRRQFNRTQTLPTILELSLALSTDNFNDMSADLETYMAYLHTYIGGDMATSHAAYDPVFLTIRAYADFLYWHWQNKQPNNLLQFPTSHSSIPMVPFNTAPKDILDSARDVCVTYTLPSKGHPCNVSRDNPTWYPGLVDVSQFSYSGYDQAGFDARGFDLYGFNEQGFDRDGYDIQGYNKEGYNRFGIDRRGRVNPDWRHQDGIDRRCLNNDGFTDAGLDQYGFSIHGYDIHYCNYSYYGPFATRESLRIWEVLLKQSKEFISTQSRTCEDLNPVSTIWVEHTWVDSLQKLVGKLPHISNKKPIIQNERFCIDVSVYPLVCQCEEGIATCVGNPCLTLTCPSNPQAVCQVDVCGDCKAKWIDQGKEVECGDPANECIDTNGNPHFPGTKWMKSQCEECICTMEGETVCGSVPCPAVACSDPVIPPGNCCPVCMECVYDGKVYLDGAQFQPDLCMSCDCRRGKSVCEETKCPPVFCMDPIQQPGQCCPTCPNVCEYDSRIIQNNQHFVPSFNPCLNCTCKRGVVRCLNVRCPAPPKGLPCSRPVAKRGECCPSICTSCKDESGKEYDDNAQWASPEDKCQICECKKTKISCRRRRCAQYCTHGKEAEGTCCPDCSECKFKGVKSSDAAIFNHTDDLGCKTCQCNKGNVTCKDPGCPRLRCREKVTPPDNCCPVCAGCSVNGRRYREDAIIPNPDNCRTCTCKYGVVKCEAVPCPAPQCSHPARPPGQCCPTCDQCLFEGRKLLANGESTTDSKDPCIQCTCKDGSVTCSNVANKCRATCSHPRMLPSECCPVCDGCMYAANEYLNGQMFRPQQDDPCHLCSCEDGNVSCDNEVCHDECTHAITVQGTCCPVCSGCQYYNKIYQNRQQFSPRKNDPCNVCNCVDGSVTCNVKICSSRCTHPIPITGLCCPKCDGCLFEGQQYLNGQPFHPDECRSCTCENGNVACETTLCAPTCSHPLPKEGECCPVCDGCLYEKNTYVSDQIFYPRPDEPCYTCTCRLGDVNCGIEKCTTKCLHPVVKRGACCPECYGCSYDNRDYLNGQVFKPISDDLCTSCSCTNGNVTCEKETCDQSCTHPMQVLGECCPVCDGCEFEGARYRDGHRFRHDRGSPCDVCECKKGNMTCGRQECRTPCKHPMPGQCCPVCDGCHFNDIDFANGQEFRGGDDPCQICTCKFGDVTCKREECNPQCHHPAPGQCCPQCDGCSYMNDTYTNKEKFFPEKDDPCVMCTCNNGTVLCDRQRCKIDCLHPVYLDKYCCPVCDSCDYDGQTWKNGEKFSPNDQDCRSCSCEDGTVTCRSMACERTCSHPIYRDGECCPECSDCQYDDRQVQNGLEFRARDNDPCRICTCQDGNIRCATVQCKAKCTHPIPKTDVCCQECDNCLYDNRLYRNGDSFNPDDDWCTGCQCSNGSVVCQTITCQPVTCSDAIYRDGQCCAECPIHCDVKGTRYRDNAQWISPDEPCILCKCNRGTVKCAPKRCAAVDCQADERLIKFQGSCCEVCVSARNLSCLHRGTEYGAGDKWQVDSCITCECKLGRVQCVSQECPIIKCGTEQSLTVSPGQCCPQCVAKPGTCISYGDPHYQTFDGETITFQGLCKYVMTKDCQNGDFTVEAQHHDRGTAGAVAWVESLIVRVGGKVVELLQKGKVKINGVAVDLPYTDDPVVYLEGFQNTVLLNTIVGLQIYWNGAGYVEVSVPGTYKNRVCGLCGNFNGFKQDDMKMKSGQFTQSPSMLGNSWKIVTPGDNCQEVSDFDPCQKAGFRVRKFANTKCAILKEPQFVKCHTAVAPDPYYASCVYDMCVCNENMDCLCDILSSYALKCAKKGVQLRWRSPALCAMKCPEKAGFIFDECGPACPRTCETRHVPLGQITDKCFKPCTPGCKCPANKVLHNDRCIDPDECPDNIVAPST